MRWAVVSLTVLDCLNERSGNDLFASCLPFSFFLFFWFCLLYACGNTPVAPYINIPYIQFIDVYYLFFIYFFNTMTLGKECEDWGVRHQTFIWHVQFPNVLDYYHCVLRRWRDWINLFFCGGRFFHSKKKDSWHFFHHLVSLNPSRTPQKWIKNIFPYLEKIRARRRKRSIVVLLFHAYSLGHRSAFHSIWFVCL